jgi:hypothetical protein
MNHISRRAKITGVLGGAALVIAGIGLESATATNQSHTLTLTAHQLRGKQLGQAAFVGTDRLVDGGKTVGFSVWSCKFDFKASQAICDGTVALQRGVLYAHLRVDADTNIGHGKIVGGTRAYKGATGTVDSKPGTHKGVARITITYSN